MRNGDTRWVAGGAMSSLDPPGMRRAPSGFAGQKRRKSIFAKG